MEIEKIIEPSKELKLIDGNITANWESYEAWQNERLDYYKTLIITDDTEEDIIKEYSNEAKTFGGAATKVDNFRKQVEGEYNKPLSTFLTKCKEAKAKNELVKKTILEKIQFAEDKRIEDRTNEISTSIEFWSVKVGLEKEYRDRITIDQKWYNKTVKLKEISDKIESQVNQLKQQQDNDKLLAKMKKERLHYIEGLCKSHSAFVIVPITVDEIKIDLIESSLDEIHIAVEKIVEKRKENEAKVREVEERKAKEAEERKAKQEADRIRREQEEKDRQAQLEIERAERARLAEIAKAEAEKKAETERAERAEKDRLQAIENAEKARIKAEQDKIEAQQGEKRKFTFEMEMTKLQYLSLMAWATDNKIVVKKI